MVQSKYCWLGWAVISLLITACTIPSTKTSKAEVVFLPISPSQAEASPYLHKKRAHRPQAVSVAKKKTLFTPQPTTEQLHLSEIEFNRDSSDVAILEPTNSQSRQILANSRVPMKKQKPVSEEPQPITYDLPIRHNKRVQKFIDFYLEKGRKAFIKGIERSGRYLPMLRKELKAAGLPEDLAYLVATESNYNPKARSRAGAAGLWQFMKATGRENGLRQNRWVDERLDPLKSTRAATQYLKYLFAKFGNWELVLAAYNAGEGRVQKGIRRAKAKKRPVDYWSLPLPRETRRYVPDYMAVTIISKDLKKYKLDHIAKAAPLDLKKLTISTDFSLQEVAKRSKMSFKELWRHNPSLIYAVPPLHQKKYDLYLPKEHELPFTISLYKYPTPAKGWKMKFARLAQSKRMTQLLTKYGSPAYIRVKKGDSLWKLSKTHRTTVRRLRHWNQVNQKGFLKIGQKIKIYYPTWKVFNALMGTPTIVAMSAPQMSSPITVKPGDTLSSLARKYGVSVKQLLRWNKLKHATALQAYQKLIVSPPKKT